MARAIMVNSDAQYYYELEHKKAVKIIQRESLSFSKKVVEAVEGGLYTKELGSLIDIDKEIKDCSCECQHLRGNFYEGQICPLCNTPVVKVYLPNLEKMGWIDLGNFYVINPEAYALIATIIPEEKFQKIINLDYSKTLSVEGNITRQEKITKSNQYDNIGLMQFRKHFDEIIRYFAKKKKEEEKGEFLIKMKNRVFTSKIMVYSSYLRPVLISSKRKQTDYDPINKAYSVIATNADILKRNKDRVSKISIPSILCTIQNTLNELYRTVINTKLKGKKKLIRAQIGGGKMSWSARCVIAPLIREDATIDSIVLPYKTFLELYSLEIINIIVNGYYPSVKFNNMTPFEIVGYVNKAKYSNVVYKDIYEIMQMLIHKHEDGLWVLATRPPVLDLGSCQVFRVIDVTKDAVNISLQVSLNSLNGYNGAIYR